MRSCYQTDFRFFHDDPDVLTPVRWFFTDAGAGMLDCPTVFGSRIWEESPRADLLLGEVLESPREWVNGRGPGAELSLRRCGPATSFALGTVTPAPGDVITIDWGIPRCCKPVLDLPCPRLSDVGPEHPLILYSFTLVITALTVHDDEALNTIMRQLLGPTATVVIAYPSYIGDVPFVFGYNAEECCIIFGGTGNAPQLLGQMLSSVAPMVNQGGFNQSFVVGLLARLAIIQAYSLGLPLDRPCVCAGYSLGGSVCAWFNARERILRPSRLVQGVTFGEPKSGDATLVTALHGRHRAIWRRNDPVPYVPPDFGLLGWLGGLFPIPVLSRWAKFRPSAGGDIIQADGTLRPWGGSLILVGDLLPLLTGYITSGFVFPGSQHSIAKYADELRIAAENSVVKLADCEVEFEVIDPLYPPMKERLMDTRYPTTISVYRVGTGPPAAPAIDMEPAEFEADFYRRTESGEGDVPAGHYTHTADVASNVDIRDDYNVGIRGPSFDTVCVPDRNGTQFAVRFVELRFDDVDGYYKRVYLDRKLPTWPTDNL